MAALTKTIVKTTDTEAVIKIAGNDTAASVISLSNDLFAYNPMIDGVGTITVGTGATSVVGVGTSFLTASHVNAKIYTSAGVYVGTIASVTNTTTATLSANGAAAIAGTTYKIQYAQQVISGTPTAAIIGVQWAGEPGVVYRVSRAGTRVMTLLADNGNFMDFIELFPPDNVNATSDISVTITDAGGAAKQGELWLRLRKTDGFASKIETAQFGIYDNVLVQGS